MTKYYKYSIIIPYFNSVDSVLRLMQSIPKLETIQVIIVNDKCPSFSGINFNTSNDIVLLNNETDKKGAGVCRNIGLLNASGKYLIFADSDDFFTEKAFDYFDECFENNFDVVYFPPVSLFLDGSIGCQRHIPYKMLVNQYLTEGDDSIRYKFYVPWSKMIKRKLIEKHSIFFDEVIASNDVNFSLKVGHFSESFTVVNSSVYCVVESSDSLTKTYTKDIVMSRFNAFCRYNSFINENNIPTKKVRMAFFLKLLAKVDFILSIRCLILVLRKRYPIL
jgi:glycosyltransferase involved in cell wall biosynthesis